MVECIDSPDELRSAIADPAALVQRLVAAAAPGLVRRWLLDQLRSTVEPLLRAAGLDWLRAVKVLQLIDTAEEIRDAITNPAAFVERVKAAAAEAPAPEAPAPGRSRPTRPRPRRLSVIEIAQENTEKTAQLNRCLKELDLTRRQLLATYVALSILLVMLAIFIYWSSAIWRNIETQQSTYESAVMPLVALYSRLKANNILDNAERGNGGDDDDDDDAPATAGGSGAGYMALPTSEPLPPPQSASQPDPLSASANHLEV
jgi:hypothetical protein